MTRRRVSRWLAGIGVTAILLVLAAAVIIQTDWARERIRQLAVRQSAPYFDGQVTIGRLEGSLLRSVTLRDVVVTQQGRRVLGAGAITVNYALRNLLSDFIQLDELVVTGASLDVVQDERGWSVAGVRIPEKAGESSGGVGISRLVLVDAAIGLKPAQGARQHFSDVDLVGSLTSAADVVKMAVESAHAIDDTTKLEVRGLSGVMRLDAAAVDLRNLRVQTPGSSFDGDVKLTGEGAAAVLDLKLNSPAIDFREVALYVPQASDVRLRPAVALTAHGPLERLQVDLSMQTDAGNASAKAVVRVAEALSAKGTLRVERLNLAPVTSQPDFASRITGTVTFEAEFTGSDSEPVAGSFDASLTELRLAGYAAANVRATGGYASGVLTTRAGAMAYGATAQAQVRWVRATNDTRASGTIRDLNLKRLPAAWAVPALESDIAGMFEVAARSSAWSAGVTFDGSTVEGADIRAGTVAAIAMSGDRVTYSACGAAARVDIARLTPHLTSVPPRVRELTGLVNVDFDVIGSGPVAAPLEHDATFGFTVIDSFLADVHAEKIRVNGTLAAGRLSATLDGGIDGAWDGLLQMPKAGIAPRVSGRAQVVIADVVGPFRMASVGGRANLSMTASAISGFDVERAVIDATLADGLLTVAKWESSGPDFQSTAMGTLALGDRGASNLKFTLDVADIAKLAGRWKIDAKGSANLEGTVTGPADKPNVAGTVHGTNVAYGEQKALAIDGTFAVELPKLTLDDMTGTGRAEATFVTLDGVAIDRVVATATYSKQKADVDLNVEHGTRRAGVAGQILLHADHQEVHVRRAQLEADGAAWQMQAGTEARINYSPSRVTVQGLDLVRDKARITIEGALALTPDGIRADGAESARALSVRLTGVQVDHLSKMWLGKDRIGGTLDATVRVSGSLDDVAVAAKFGITDGRADDIPFKSVGGIVDYRAGGAKVDVRLDAGDRGEMSVIGTTPIAATSTTALQLDVKAHLTDVGLLAPVMADVKDLSGAADVAIGVTGTYEAPSVTGTVTLDKLRFHVVPVGVSYRELNAALRFDKTLMVVERFSMQDDDGHLLRLEGNLDVLSSRSSRALNVRASAAEFHVLNNQFGELVVNIDLTAGGDLRAPQVIGSVTVVQGRLQADRLLEEFSTTAYQPTGTVITRPADTSAPTPAPMNLFAGSAFTIDIRLPDNVIVRGRGVKLEEGLIGLGDINLTMGGTLTVSKAPSAEPRLFGELAVVRGTYDFQGRRFALLRGSDVRFRGETPINPVLSLTGEREMSGIRAEVRVEGTLYAPRIALSSQPSLDQGEILSLIVFNRPINQLGASQKISLATRAGALAASALATPIADSVARALDLDVFEIQTGDSLATGTAVMVGRQISDRVFVGFKHEFGAEGANRLTFEYRLTEFLRVVSSIAQGADAARASARTEAAGIDLVFVIRR